MTTRPKTQQRFGDLKPMKVALSENIRKASVIDLNRALADTIVLRDLYKKHHWQVSGPTFRELHLLFDEHQAEQGELIDQIAGAHHAARRRQHRHGRGRRRGERDPAPAARPRAAGARSSSAWCMAHEIVLSFARQAARRASEQGDDGTNDLFVSDTHPAEREAGLVRQRAPHQDGIGRGSTLMARIAVGGFHHETNCFVAGGTDFAYFASHRDRPPLVRGASVIEMAGRLPASRSRGFLRDMSAGARRSCRCCGPAVAPAALVTADAYERIAGELVGRLSARPCRSMRSTSICTAPWSANPSRTARASCCAACARRLVLQVPIAHQPRLSRQRHARDGRGQPTA